MASRTQATITLATILVLSSSIGLLASGVAVAMCFVIPDTTGWALVTTVVVSVITPVVGIAGVWIHRGRAIVSAVATMGYLTVGATLTVGAAGTLQSAAEGGFVNIGAMWLLLVGAALTVPSVALTLILAFFVARDRRRRIVGGEGAPARRGRDDDSPRSTVSPTRPR